MEIIKRKHTVVSVVRLLVYKSWYESYNEWVTPVTPAALLLRYEEKFSIVVPRASG